MKKLYNTKKKKIVLVSIIGIVLLLLGSLFYIKSKIDKTNSDNYKTSLRAETPDATDPVGVLLIGTDSGGNRSAEEGARSDTLIYATVNPKTKETHLYSISRDIYTWVDENNYQKINASYSIGQEKQAAKAVEKLLDAPVDYYLSVNMTALSQIVDELDGIDVNNKLGDTISISDTEPDYKAEIKPGKQHINGEQALVYSRMRYQDPEGDVGRQKRQQEVIQAIIKKLKQPSTLLKIEPLLDIVGDNVKTNVKSENMITLYKSYLNAISNMKSTNIIGHGEMIQGSYYMIVGKNNMLEIQQKIKKELDLEVNNKLSWIDDENMLYIDDKDLELDPSTHYDFVDFKIPTATKDIIEEKEIPFEYNEPVKNVQEVIMGENYYNNTEVQQTTPQEVNDNNYYVYTPPVTPTAPQENNDNSTYTVPSSSQTQQQTPTQSSTDIQSTTPQSSNSQVTTPNSSGGESIEP